MGLIDFQEDIKNGMTIEDALTKHHLSFQYVCKNIGKVKRWKIPEKTPVDERRYFNVQKTPDGKFRVYKQVGGQNTTFGTYRTMEDAIRIREHCHEHGWVKTNVDRYCRELGIERCHGAGRRCKYS